MGSVLKSLFIPLTDAGVDNPDILRLPRATNPNSSRKTNLLCVLLNLVGVGSHLR